MTQKQISVTFPDGSNLQINNSTCLDFVYFRKIMRDMRRPDDNINHRLNKIDPSDPKQCEALWKEMTVLHEDRQRALNFCLGSLKTELEMNPDDSRQRVLRKEVRTFSAHIC